MMITAKKVRGTAMSMPAGVGVGVCIGLVITILFAAVLAMLVLEGKIGEMFLGYFVMGILLLASFLGALLSALKVKRRWMLVCFITGGVYYLILLIVTALFFGGNYQGVGASGVMVLLGSLASGGLGIRMKRSGNESYKKYRAC